MGKTSLFPSLTLSTPDLKEVAGGSKVLHIKRSKFKCWSLASGCGGHCSTEGESAGGVGFMPQDFITGIQKVTSWHFRFPFRIETDVPHCAGTGSKGVRTQVVPRTEGVLGTSGRAQRCSLVTSSIGSAWHTQPRLDALSFLFRWKLRISVHEVRQKPSTCLPEWAPDGVLKVINFQAIV